MFSAVVLAGERPGGSALTRQLKLKAGVLVDVAGKSALRRVVEALQGARLVSGGVLCGPAPEVYRDSPEFERILRGTAIRWMAPEAGPSASAIKAIKALSTFPVLLTTGDHALLTPELIDSFCEGAESTGADIVAGLVPYATVQAAFPQSRRTIQRFSDGGFCGTNLYAILTPSGLSALAFWRSVEAQRKRPWKIARKLGLCFLLRFLLHRVSLHQALHRLSVLSGCRVSCVLLDSARAAVDVDSVADRDLADQILRAEPG